MIEFKNVSKVYHTGVSALNKANLKIADGDFVFIVGSSGSGKSTLIKLILREEEVSTGKVYVDGVDITKLKRKKVPYLRRKMGVVFQDFRLIEGKTVYENVAFAMEMIGAGKSQIKRQVPMVLALVGISDKASRMPHELSGGEQQRVSIARALVNNPSVIIADEPTGNLDPKTAWDIMALFKEINKRGTTVVMVTHAHEIVDAMEERVVQVHKGSIVRDDRKGGYLK